MNVQTLEHGIQAGAFTGKRVLVRVDFNVPLDGGRVTDDLRIQAALPTINALREAGARVVLMSHLGRPKGQRVPEMSLLPVANRLSNLINAPVAFAEDCIGEAAESTVSALTNGHVCLLENLRFHAGETEGDEQFTQQLAELGDVYVNDAFGTAHRAHASTTLVAAHMPAYAGKLIEKELRILGDALDEPKRPFTAILGGAKVSDKIAVMDRLIQKADRIIIGGGMAFTFLKAQGHDVGKSLVEEDRLDYALDMLKRAETAGVEVLLPVDVEEADKFHAKATHHAAMVTHIAKGWMGLDIGPITMQNFGKAIADSGTVLWNGPMGVFEWDAFKFGTRAVAQALMDCRGTTIIGGGDSAAAARKFGIQDHVTHISTGGGASLEFLEGKTLPGIAALEAAAKTEVA